VPSSFVSRPKQNQHHYVHDESESVQNIWFLNEGKYVLVVSNGITNNRLLNERLSRI
jgi:hypothetical protein